MPNPFSRTLRSLEADGFRRSTWGMGLVMALLAAWGVWFFLAQVSLYEVSPAARLEVDLADHPVETAMDGRVVTVQMRLGDPVEAGQVLVELDAEEERLRVQEEQSRLDAASAQLEALQVEMAAERKGLEETRRATKAALEEAQAQFRQAQVAARFADGEFERAKRLRAAGQLPESEMQRTKADAERLAEAAEVLRLTVSRIEPEQQAIEQAQQAKIAQLQRESARLQGQASTSAASLLVLGQQLEHHKIRAPVAGRLGEVAPLRVGAVVQQGDRLGTIVTSEHRDGFRAVALFSPAAALGRIWPGQPAHLRLDGFPWTQYGTLSATVATVASEMRDGQIRVELRVKDDPASRIPMQHGLRGTLEIEIERISPALLLLRTMGKLLQGVGRSAAPAAEARTIPVRIRGHELQAEIAADPASRNQGLMFRRELPENSGMLFVYAESAIRGFSMRNTTVALSIAFLDERGIILNIEDLQPLDETNRLSEKPARYALEVRQGWFVQRGIRAGDRCEFSLPPGLAPS